MTSRYGGASISRYIGDDMMLSYFHVEYFKYERKQQNRVDGPHVQSVVLDGRESLLAVTTVTQLSALHQVCWALHEDLAKFAAAPPTARGSNRVHGATVTMRSSRSMVDASASSAHHWQTCSTTLSI